MFPSLDFAIFPLKNPALVSVPIAFALGYLATVLSKNDMPTRPNTPRWRCAR